MRIFLSVLLVVCNFMFVSTGFGEGEMSDRDEFAPLWETSFESSENKLKVFTLNQLGFDRLISEVDKGDGSIGSSVVRMAIPTPQGELIYFLVAPAGTISPELQKKYPYIKAYSGVSEDNEQISLRFQVGPSGFQGEVKSPNGMYEIEPSDSDGRYRIEELD